MIMDAAAPGQFPTPLWVAEALVERHFGVLDRSDFVLEPSCGNGSFLRAIPWDIPALGVEIDPLLAEQARSQTGRQVLTGDFLTLPLTVRPTAIIGNPPFKLSTIDAFLDRARKLLPEGGRVGFVLPAYAFQTAGRVARYAEDWGISQEMIPRNIYPGLRLPLVFAVFSKDQRRTLVGFALYREAADVQKLPEAYRRAFAHSDGPLWKCVCETALQRLGGEADLQQIYTEVEGSRPTRTKFWREGIRKNLRAFPEIFAVTGRARYALRAVAAVA